MAEDIGDDGVVAEGVLGGGDAACRLEADLAAACLVVCGDALAHHEGGSRSGVDVNLAGRGLDEVGAGFHCQEGSVRDILEAYEQAGFKNHLEHHLAAELCGFAVDDLLHTDNLVKGLLAVAFEERVEGEDDVDFLCAVSHGKGAFEFLDLNEALGRREAARNHGHVELRIVSGLGDRLGEVWINAD